MSKARDNQCGLAKAGAPPFCGSEEGVGASTVGVPLQLGKSNNASLLSKNNSLERAVDWIFSHIDDLDAEAAMDISEVPLAQTQRLSQQLSLCQWDLKSGMALEVSVPGKQNSPLH